MIFVALGLPLNPANLAGYVVFAMMLVVGDLCCPASACFHHLGGLAVIALGVSLLVIAMDSAPGPVARRYRDSCSGS